jgi:hypothetical protein
MLQQQAAHYEMDPRTTNYQQFDYTLIQPHSFVKWVFFFLFIQLNFLFRFESQSIISAFNPQASGSTQQDPHLGQTPMMPWLSTNVAAQQQQTNQQTPYGSSSNQYIISNNQDNYLQSLANFHQSPATHPSFQPHYWSAVPTALMFPAPPTQTILTQQQTLNNEPHSPQSKTNNNNRPLTPSNSSDLLSTSQPNQQPQYINMPRTTQTPGTKTK